jgi:NADH dehydrogenase
MPAILVLGAGYAGIEAALRVRRLQPEASVTVVGEGAYLAERIRLHQVAVGDVLTRHRITDLLEPAGAEYVEARAIALLPEAKQVVLNNGACLGWDILVYALGSMVDMNRVPGVAEHALALDARTLERLGRALPGAREVTVVGGGLSGIEGASEVAEHCPNARVTWVARGWTEPFCAKAQAHIRRTMARLGVTLVENEQVVRVDEGRVLTERASIATDLCLWAGGFRAPPLAASAGLPVNARGQLLVDGYLRVPGTTIFGAGDAACITEAVGSHVHMSCKTALPMAAHAADTICALLAGTRPTRFSFRDGGICVSLGRRNGVFQTRRLDGTPSFAMTGRSAAFLKEQVCRFTVSALKRERDGKPFRWLRAPAAQPDRGTARVLVSR